MRNVKTSEISREQTKTFQTTWFLCMLWRVHEERDQIAGYFIIFEGKRVLNGAVPDSVEGFQASSLWISVLYRTRSFIRTNTSL